MASPTDAVAAAMDKIGLTVTDANGNYFSSFHHIHMNNLEPLVLCQDLVQFKMRSSAS